MHESIRTVATPPCKGGKQNNTSPGWAINYCERNFIPGGIGVKQEADRSLVTKYQEWRLKI